MLSRIMRQESRDTIGSGSGGRGGHFLHRFLILLCSQKLLPPHPLTLQSALRLPCS